MKISELLVEAKTERKIVVVYGGRFQPFHRGHYACYKWLCEKFGKRNVWLATSDKVSLEDKQGVSPFSFVEKKEIIVSLYDIAVNRVVKCKNPAFMPREIFKMYHGYDVIYIAAVGDKDEARYAKSDFFSPLPDDFKERDLGTLEDKKAYYVVVPVQSKGISGTEAREALMGDGDREKIFRKYFGKYDSVIDQLMVARLKELK